MDIPNLLLSSWHTVLRTLFLGVSTYASLIVLLRISGKRTLSKWNAFDFIVTIALGSTLATAILSKQTSLAQGVIALALLILLQYLITALSVRFPYFQRLVKARPRLLLLDGVVRQQTLVEERVSEEELRAALRERGLSSYEEAAAVVLETNGTFSVLTSLSDSPGSAIRDVEGFSPKMWETTR
ncbi:MAG: DUF421 domain-containing protein [Bdellovibrionales bacterium]|nr:DUF421 domain-containing protein [Bdellovibrionales bacterium]